MIILDVASPMRGVASVVVPRGEVFIDPGTRDVVLTRVVGGMQRHIRWTWREAATTGEVLVMAAHATRDEPDPDQVQKLATLMADPM
ncbi:hypothetical protein [Nonomuraea recticatena]|uniref:hypothetical protein n=1 Tax=Nonomuraea recticatena TaxID=46178 RepID=UPI0031F9F0AC